MYRRNVYIVFPFYPGRQAAELEGCLLYVCKLSLSLALPYPPFFLFFLPWVVFPICAYLCFSYLPNTCTGIFHPSMPRPPKKKKRKIILSCKEIKIAKKRTDSSTPIMDRGQNGKGTEGQRERGIERKDSYTPRKCNKSKPRQRNEQRTRSAM